MNILYHHRTQGTGAEGVHIAYIIKGLRGLGYEVTVVSPRDTDPAQTAGGNPFAKKKGWKSELLDGVSRILPQFLFEILEMNYNKVAAVKLGKALSAKPIECIYERYAFFMTAGVDAAKKRAIPIIVEVNEIAGHKRVREQFFVNKAKQAEKFIFENASAIIVVSQFLKDEIAGLGIDADKIFVIPNAVDADNFDPSLFSRDSTLDARRSSLEKPSFGTRDSGLEKSLGFEQRAANHEPRETSDEKRFLVIGFIGWFVEWHNLRMLIEAFAEVVKKEGGRGRIENGREKIEDRENLSASDLPLSNLHSQSSLKLLLIGDGILKDELKSIAQEKGVADQVLFPGAVPYEKVPECIAAMDICVIPASNEYRSPIKMFEYMAMEKAVVAPRLQPIGAVIEDGVSGLLFTPDDRTSLEQSLTRLIDDADKRHLLGKAARAVILGKHTWVKNAELITEIIKSRM